MEPFLSIVGRTTLKRPPKANSQIQTDIDRTSPEFHQRREAALDEMVQGYRDGLDPDSPAPSSNRSLSYAHGFHVGQGDCQGQPFHDAATLRLLAETALDADALAACGQGFR
jgi:hypothetical protein